MIEQVKNFFYFSKGEKNGIIVLVILIIILFFFPYIYDNFKPIENDVSNNFEQEIEDFKNSLKKAESSKYTNRLDNFIVKRYDSIDLFFFNPNNCSKQKFKKLGLTDKQISTIKNYLNKGGKFIEKNDFQKIYGIRNQQYIILKPYILLPENKIFKKTEYIDNHRVDESQIKDSLFQFDPNNTKKEDWLILGFSNKQINTIFNYINKGGKFYKKVDLKKIYSISENQYSKVEPFINIKEQSNNQIIETINIVELNSATFEDLININGVGKYFANSIIYYRKKLGGFSNKKQLLEIKHFDEEKLKKIENQIKIDQSKISLIRINFVEFKELFSHPYLNHYQSKEIINYRNVNGAYINKKQLLDNKILLKHTYQRIETYITTN